jgi:5-methylcytosine-specific restriction protein A
MPKKIPSNCSTAGCPGLSTKGTGRCDKCMPKYNYQKEDRPSAHARGYTSQWTKIRDWYIRREPICEHCRENLAEEIDHIIPLRHGGGHDIDNLQALCKRCHTKKTHQDMRKYNHP